MQVCERQRHKDPYIETVSNALRAFCLLNLSYLDPLSPICNLERQICRQRNCLYCILSSSVRVRQPSNNRIAYLSSFIDYLKVYIFYWLFQNDRLNNVKFALGSGISIILALTGISYTLNYGIYQSDLTPWLEERFWELFHEMDYNERSARIMRIIQEDVRSVIR